MKSTQAEGKDDIMKLSEQIAAAAEWQYRSHQNTAESVTPPQSGRERDGNGKQYKILGVKVKIESMARDVNHARE